MFLLYITDMSSTIIDLSVYIVSFNRNPKKVYQGTSLPQSVSEETEAQKAVSAMVKDKEVRSQSGSSETALSHDTVAFV